LLKSRGGTEAAGDRASLPKPISAAPPTRGARDEKLVVDVMVPVLAGIGRFWSKELSSKLPGLLGRDV
jgi:hypothetical protein